MQLHIDRLGPLNRLTIFFRSTAPGHPSCEQRLAPYADGADAREKEKNIPERMMAVTDDEAMKSTRRRWDWDQFAVHNEFWREEIKKLMEGRTKELPRRDGEVAQAEEGPLETRAAIPAGDSGAKWYYLDIYELSLQRPDAHDSPGLDCLHCECSTSEVRTCADSFTQGACRRFWMNGRDCCTISST